MLRAFWQIRKSGLSARDKAKATFAELRFNLRRFFPIQNPANLMGRRIPYIGLDELNGLFEELFVRESYRSCVTGDRPLIIDCGSNIGMSIMYVKTQIPGAPGDRF